MGRIGDGEDGGIGGGCGLGMGGLGMGGLGMGGGWRYQQEHVEKYDL